MINFGRRSCYSPICAIMGPRWKSSRIQIKRTQTQRPSGRAGRSNVRIPVCVCDLPGLITRQDASRSKHPPPLTPSLLSSKLSTVSPPLFIQGMRGFIPIYKPAELSSRSADLWTTPGHKRGTTVNLGVQSSIYRSQRRMQPFCTSPSVLYESSSSKDHQPVQSSDPGLVKTRSGSAVGPGAASGPYKLYSAAILPGWNSVWYANTQPSIHHLHIDVKQI